MFQALFYGTLRKFQGCLKKVSRVFQGRLMNDESFNGDLSGVLGCLKEVQWVYKESFNSAPRWFQGIF